MTQLSKAELSEYNFIVAVDTSGSMGAPNRWEQAKSIALSVANFAGQVDTNGIDIITFGATVNAYENATADKIAEIFNTEKPNGSTPLNEAIVLANQVRLKSNKKAFTVVVTDGAPDDEAAVAKTLTDIANSINQNNDSSFLFIQIGDDAGATQFLTRLDDNLKGGKFDIVDRRTIEEFNAVPFETLFYNAQHD